MCPGKSRLVMGIGLFTLMAGLCLMSCAPPATERAESVVPSRAPEEKPTPPGEPKAEPIKAEPSPPQPIAKPAEIPSLPGASVKPPEQPAAKQEMRAEPPAPTAPVPQPQAQPTAIAPTPEQLAEKMAQERERLAKLFPPDAASWTFDDFERVKPEWRVENWGNPAELSIVQREGTNQLRVLLKGGEKDKCAIIKACRVNLATRTKLTLDVENGLPEPVGIALAIVTDQWYETRATPLASGKNRVLFDLRSQEFKAESTKWAFTSPLNNPAEPKWIVLLFYTQKPGELHLDNIQFHADTK